MSIAGLKITLKAYFSFNPFLVTLLALAFFVGCFLIQKRRCVHLHQEISFVDILWQIVLSLYLAFLVGATLMNRTISNIYQYRLAPFWSYKMLIAERNLALATQMVTNVLLFLPWCFLMSKLSPRMCKFRWGVGSAFVFSAFVEITQLVFRCGFFEFDDIFHNTLGAMIGYAFLRVYRLKHPIVLRSDSETTIQRATDDYENET